MNEMKIFHERGISFSDHKRQHTDAQGYRMITKKENAKNWTVLDMHTHLLPGVDDGARDLATALEMLRIAVTQRITKIIVTPHFRLDKRSAAPESIYHAVQEVQEAASAANIPIKLYPGNEVTYFEELPSFLHDKRVCTMNETHYVLIEFSPYVLLRNLQNAMDKILTHGYLPILAHAERYECLIKEHKHCVVLHEMGVQIQLNADSVTGTNGGTLKRLTHRLLHEGVVDYIATDAHSAKHRSPMLAHCQELLIKKFGDSYARQLLWENAMRHFALDTS
jgi:protein-tyrosine phosphatase